MQSSLADCEVEVLLRTVFKIDAFNEKIYKFCILLMLSIVEYEEALVILSCAIM